MADWRQIQARIRKAKNSPDASSKLSELYQRTRDAMVAWELGAIEEKAGRNEEAGRWYIISAQRFRRADWKKKAQEALARLGIEVPAPGTEPPPPPATERSRSEAREETDSGDQIPVLGEISDLSADADDDTANGSAPEAEAAASASAQDGTKKKRRRGRRGGRGRHRKGAAGATPGLPSKAFAEPVAPSESRLPSSRVDARSETRIETHFDPRLERTEFHAEEVSSESAAEVQRAPVAISSVRRSSVEHATPMLPSERTAHGRAGDPALASRLSRLESMLRRLVSSPLHNLDQAEEAPAGPGVFLLSDSDQITSYYVEACQTLRVGIGNLVRGSRGSKAPRGSGRGYPDTSGLKAKLAEHLEINEAKVSQYLKDHCVIRWIQLDDDAPMLAHFAIAVLRTPLNIE
ncbi:MAG TPA: hypothetical protein VGH17_06625 [Candidatus Acidoferrales bacterium]|jgi:hypothetical protein